MCDIRRFALPLLLLLIVAACTNSTEVNGDVALRPVFAFPQVGSTYLLQREHDSIQVTLTGRSSDSLGFIEVAQFEATGQQGMLQIAYDGRGDVHFGFDEGKLGVLLPIASKLSSIHHDTAGFDGVIDHINTISTEYLGTVRHPIQGEEVVCDQIRIRSWRSFPLDAFVDTNEVLIDFSKRLGFIVLMQDADDEGSWRVVNFSLR